MKGIVVDLSPLDKLGDGGLANSELTNGEHVIIKCSRCRKKLCDVWRTQPLLDVHSKIVVDCDYCGDRSYEHDIRGKFHLGVTDDSGLSDIKNEFIDGPSGSTGIYQKIKIATKRLK